MKVRVIFETVFHVVDKCNSPLLCLRDAERAGLVRVETSYTPATIVESKTAPGTYKDEIISLKLKPEAVSKQFPPRKVPLALQDQAKMQL